MDESLEGLAWLLSTLQANATIIATMTGGVHALQASEGAAYPYVVVTPMAPRDVIGAAGTRLMVDGTYQVRIWGDATQSDTMQSALNTADSLLQQTRHQTTPSGLAEVLFCERVNPLPPLPDWNGNALVIGIGGLYRLQVRSL